MAGRSVSYRREPVCDQPLCRGAPDGFAGDAAVIGGITSISFDRPAYHPSGNGL